MRPFLPIICIISILSCHSPKTKANESRTGRAKEIHKDVITIDTHVDIEVKNFTDSINYTSNLETQVNLPKMETGGLDVAWFVVYTRQDSLNADGYAKAAKNAHDKFDAIHRLYEQYAPGQLGLALTPSEVKRLHGSGKKIAMIGVENAYPMGRDLSNFQKYYEMGARYISLAHNGHSQFCDSHTGESTGEWLHNGLSDLGIAAVKEMNKLGIMIDVSHLSKASMLQIISLSKAPVIASHSAARRLCDHSRNLDDEQLDKIRDNGGVVQTVALDAYLNSEKAGKRAGYMESLYRKVADSLGVARNEASVADRPSIAQLETILEKYPQVKKIAQYQSEKDVGAPRPVDISDLADHIDYMVNRIGIDHVGISSDFDGGGGIEGWGDASETFNITLELVERGYSEEDISKLWGGNLLRVMEEVQKAASQGQNL
jgi:membrane dipeptidase